VVSYRLQDSSRSKALLSREEEEEEKNRIDGVAASFREVAVFGETWQPSNFTARSCSYRGQCEGVVRNLTPYAVPLMCDSCQSKPVLRICEECLTSCAAYFSEKSGGLVATETRRGTDYEEDPIGKKEASIITV
jgi:hypothetical protein